VRFTGINIFARKTPKNLSYVFDFNEVVARKGDGRGI